MDSGANRFLNSVARYFALLLCVVVTVSVFAQDKAPTKDSQHQQVSAQQANSRSTLAIGSSAPDFSLVGIDGKKHQLSEYKNGKALAVLFTCNTCPVSQMYEDRIKKLVADYGPKGLILIAIQSNLVVAESPSEMSYSDLDDSLDSMKTRADFRSFNFPYLYDGETQTATMLYGPTATPDIFIFDSQRKLRYEGRIDDNIDEARVQTQDARAALDEILSGKPVATPTTVASGCTIKGKAQNETSQAELKEWESKPVNLDVATAEVLTKLRQNPTGKTLIVTFWATWCGPCVEEFPDLLQTYLMYRARGVDLVAVSVDSPDAKAGVLQFLTEHHSGVRNLQFASEDLYALQAAFDKHWDSGVPYTMVMAPDGGVIYEEMGEVHLLRLRRAILASLPDQGPYSGNADYWAKAIAAGHGH